MIADLLDRRCFVGLLQLELVQLLVVETVLKRVVVLLLVVLQQHVDDFICGKL